MGLGGAGAGIRRVLGTPSPADIDHHAKRCWVYVQSRSQLLLCCKFLICPLLFKARKLIDSDLQETLRARQTLLRGQRRWAGAATGTTTIDGITTETSV